MFYSENLYYLLCCCTNPIFGKKPVPEIYAKMLSANQIAGFLNILFLQITLMKQPHFLHVDTNSQDLKVDWKFFWTDMMRKWCSQSGLWTLKLTLSQEWTNRFNCFLTFWYKFTQIKRWLKMFGVGMVKKKCGQPDDRNLKFTVYWRMNRWNKLIFCTLIQI